jgi:hypothetical protein
MTDTGAFAGGTIGLIVPHLLLDWLQLGQHLAGCHNEVAVLEAMGQIRQWAATVRGANVEQVTEARCEPQNPESAIEE